ncbi:MAG: hypothetical protein R2834_07360 [Rhodothermales bacterium]
MQGLFYSVTTTFSALVLTLFLYVIQHKEELATNRAQEAYMAQAQAAYFIQSLQDDIENMFTPEAGAGSESPVTCRLSMTRNGRTRSFTFPTLRYRNGDSEPSIVHVTYELEGQARQIETRKGMRDLYRLRRFIDEGDNVLTLGGSSTQIVDFLVELFPHLPDGNSDLRVLSGDCPTDLNQVRVEFRIAVPENSSTNAWSDSTVYTTTARYTATVHPRNEAMSIPQVQAD